MGILTSLGTTLVYGVIALIAGKKAIKGVYAMGVEQGKKEKDEEEEEDED